MATQKNNCSREKICAKCGENYHAICNNPLKCSECGENHSAFDKECPIWNDEVEIKKIQTEKRITIREARQIRRETVPLVPRKYTNEKYSTIVTGNTNVTPKRNLEMTSDEDENNKNSNVDTQETVADLTGGLSGCGGPRACEGPRARGNLS